jgi:hypothetical protein
MIVINIDTIGENMSSAPKAARSWLNNQAGKLTTKLTNKNPILRRAASQLIDNLLPGFGGGTPDLTDNAFREAIAGRVQQLVASTDLAGDVQIANLSDAGKLGNSYDWRARLRPKDGGKSRFFSRLNNEANYLLQPLDEAGGLVWQYTPTIFLSGSAEYNEALMQGMNYPINTFISSRPPDIPITADFSANDIYEARYLLAIMTFLKICTKAYFGDDAVARGTAGTPPPVLLFEYLGDYGFNKVPVVVTNYSMQLPDNVDYVPVQVGDTITYVPTLTNIMINLKPQYTPHKLRRRFSLEAITSGASYTDGFM